jgi:fatty-acyl-CoA synthase
MSTTMVDEYASQSMPVQDAFGEEMRVDSDEGAYAANFAWKRAHLHAATAGTTKPAPPVNVQAPALVPTPAGDSLPRRFADFQSLSEALDYAAQGQRGLNFYDSRGRLSMVLPYAELKRRAEIVAGQLVALGVHPGARVALIAETSAEFLALFMGCAYAAVLPVPLPLPVSFGGREGYVQQLKNQLESCDPQAVVGPEAMMGLLQEASTDLALRFCGGWKSFDALPIAAQGRRGTAPGDIAYLQYSSGSTRFPHGVAVTHRALLENCMLMGKHGIGILESDRCISWLPFYHDMGLVGCFLTCLTCQVSTDYIATEDFTRRPLTWLRLISANPGTTCTYSPTFGYDIAARRASAEVAASLDLSRWRLAGNGGDMIRPDVMQRFIDTFSVAGFRPEAFMPSYGLAECTLGVSFMPHGRGIELELVDEERLSGVGIAPTQQQGAAKRYRAIVNCGQPLPGYEVAILDNEGAPVLGQAIGRLYVKGASVMQGYFRDEAATNDCLSPEGWLDTGDMAFMKEGCLYIVGRAKDMIIINGKNHWPQDIEWAVEQMAGLKSGDIAAFGMTNDAGEETAVVLVQCRTSQESERLALKNAIAARVKSLTHVDCTVVLVPPRSLPRTSSGKLSRSKARSLYLDGAFQTIEFAQAV